MKIREIITVKGWQDGSGWSYEQTISDKIFNIDEKQLEEDMNWDWWDADDHSEDGEDTRITVSYYKVDADIWEDKPLASWSVWESELQGEE